MTTTLRLFPNKSKTNPKTNKTPIYGRLLQGRRKKEFRLEKEFDLTPSELLKWNEFTERVDLKDSPINEYLNAISARFKESLTAMRLKGINFSLEELLPMLGLQKAGEFSCNEPTVVEYVDKYLREEIETPKREEGTKKNYRNAIRQFKNYMEYKGLEKMKLKEFKFEQANGFKLFLEMDIAPEFRKGFLAEKEVNTEVSSSTKCKNIKPIFEKAISEELITQNPFSKVKLKFESENYPRINAKQVRDFFNLDLNHLSKNQFAKDIFLFMCFTGLSIGDTLTLSADEIKFEQDDRLMIDTTRIKTKKMVRQIALKPAQKIIEKYWNPKENKFQQNIFPIKKPISEAAVINEKLKVLGAMAGIPFSISTKTARITAREMLYESGISDRLIVDSIMGWSHKDKVQSKYFSITVDKLMTAAALFEIYVNKVLFRPQELENELISRLNELKWD